MKRLRTIECMPQPMSMKPPSVAVFTPVWQPALRSSDHEPCARPKIRITLPALLHLVAVSDSALHLALDYLEQIFYNLDHYYPYINRRETWTRITLQPLW